MPINTVKRTKLNVNRMWERSRAVIDGEAAVKALDKVLDTDGFTNVLVPFGKQMTQDQYNFYKAEAELPGLVGQYVKIIVGGLLRKPPALEIKDPQESNRVKGEPIPENEKMLESINRHLVTNNSGLLAFLLKVLSEELTTSRSAISIAVRDDPQNPTGVKAYPILWSAEEIINYQTDSEVLTRVVFKYNVDEDDGDAYDLKTFVYYEDHFLNKDGFYQVDTYKEGINNKSKNTKNISPKTHTRTDTLIPEVNGEPFDWVPVWFTNGNVDPIIPMLTPMVDKELTLYNKLSRRNHLMYGSCSYTPIIFSSMDEQQFANIVNKGLGVWIKLNQDDKVDVFKAPTESLSDLDKAIKGNIDELGRMGIRLLTPEVSGGVSGIALEIRNSPQTAQLGLLNTRVSDTLQEVIEIILYWNYGEKFKVELNMSEISTLLHLENSGYDW